MWHLCGQALGMRLPWHPRSALSLESVMAKYATQGNVQMPPLPFQGLEVLTAQTSSLGPTPSFKLILNYSNETQLSLRSGRAAFWILQWWFEYAAQFRTGFRSRDCATSHLIRGGQRMQDSQAWPTMAAYRTHNVWQMYRTMQEQCIKPPANVSQAKDLALELKPLHCECNNCSWKL